ncbi:MAG: hypothetical protein Q9188_002345 [Gyalolechia gomerana]
MKLYGTKRESERGNAVQSLDLPDTLSTLLIWHPAAHWCVVEKVVQQLEFLITTLGRSNLYAIIPIAHPVAHMILTLKPSLQNGYASPHAYSPIQQPPSSTFSPAIKPAALPPLSASSPRRMGTPHRGLPPPSAMTLPNPERGPSTSSMSIGQLPAAPSQWHGAEESMRNWLQAKSEEERRKQEEQKTQQESLKLEQRRVEQTILRESLQGGIPPYMVPMVFAGMAGGTLPNTALEWAQHAMASITLQQQAQLQQQQQQQQAQQQQPQQQQHQQPSQAPAQSSSDQRRLTGPQPNPYGPQQLQQAPRAATPQTQQNTGFAPSYQSSNVSVDRARLPGPSPTMAPSTSAARQPSSTLPRLNTVETPVQQVPQAHPGLQLPAQHPLQQTQHAQQQEQQVSSPIYFHHWVPPNTQGSSNKDPGTPTGKSQHGSPFSQTQTSYLRSDYTSSPKKRKATGAHHAAPAPSSGPPNTSPSFSHTSSGSTSGRRRGRSRQQSDASSHAANDPSGSRHHRSRTESGRQSNSEAESSGQRPNSAQAETRPSRQHQQPAPQREPQERSDGNSPQREHEGSS